MMNHTNKMMCMLAVMGLFATGCAESNPTLTVSALCGRAARVSASSRGTCGESTGTDPSSQQKEKALCKMGLESCSDKGLELYGRMVDCVSQLPTCTEATVESWEEAYRRCMSSEATNQECILQDEADPYPAGMMCGELAWEEELVIVSYGTCAGASVHLKALNLMDPAAAADNDTCRNKVLQCSWEWWEAAGEYFECLIDIPICSGANQLDWQAEAAQCAQRGATLKQLSESCL